MASSDNVLRAGLTHKPIAVDELLAVLDPACGPASVIARPTGQVAGWPVPVDDFRLRRVSSNLRGRAGSCRLPRDRTHRDRPGDHRHDGKQADTQPRQGGVHRRRLSELTITGQGEIMFADCPPLD